MCYANLMHFLIKTNFGLYLLFCTNSFTVVIDPEAPFNYEPLIPKQLDFGYVSIIKHVLHID